MKHYKKSNLIPYGVMIEPINNTTLDSLSIEELKELFHQEHLVLLRGFNNIETKEEFEDYCEKWGEISIWPFGKVLDLIQQDNPEDHIFDNSYMPLHWDGMYRPQVPEYQIFQCVKAPNAEQGGRTTFSNTILALKNSPKKDIELWEKVTGIYERKMEFYNSRTMAPIISKHPYKDYSVIRYNEPHLEEKGDFVNPPNMQFTGIPEQDIDTLHSSLRNALYDKNHFYAHEWQTGDIVINDNFSLLHGREMFFSHSQRHIRRVQVLSNPPFNNPNLESYK